MKGRRARLVALTVALGACVDRAAIAPFVCDGVNQACPILCTSDEHCEEGLGCIAGSCVGLLGLGAPCVQDAECYTGHCVVEGPDDGTLRVGVCCNRARRPVRELRRARGERPG